MSPASFETSRYEFPAAGLTSDRRDGRSALCAEGRIAPMLAPLLRKIPVLSVLLVLGIPSAASAQTRAPNCEYQDGRSDLGLEKQGDGAPPKFIAWDNRGEFESYISEPGTANGHVEVIAADPARPIAHPFSVPQTRVFQRHRVEAVDGDGPVKIVVSWEEDTYSTSGPTRCRRYSEAIIETGPGIRPIFKTRRSGVWLYPGPKQRCEALADAHVRIKVAGERTRETFSQPGVCTGESSRRGDSRYFRIAVTGGGAKFVPLKARTNEDWQFRYTAYVGGKVRKRGRIAVTNVYRPGRRVYGFHANGSLNDEYWNYCVNEGKTVWMHNGNPYCIRPSYRSQRVVMR